MLTMPLPILLLCHHIIQYPEDITISFLRGQTNICQSRSNSESRE